MKNRIILIRITIFLIFFLMLAGVVIIECVEFRTTRNILFVVMCVVCALLAATLAQKSRFAAERVTILDLLNIAMFIGLMIYLVKGLPTVNTVQFAFQGNNAFLSSYHDGIGGKRYDEIESALEDEIKYRKKELYHNKLEEIYRIQIDDKIFVFVEEDEREIAELEYFKQNDFYYNSGNKVLCFDGIGSSDSYTTEETIRKDIANTMWRGVRSDEVGMPAWGVSTDEQIYSMTINGKKADDIILINEKDGKKYYFWIISDIGEIKSIEDVKAAKIEMDGLQ